MDSGRVHALSPCAGRTRSTSLTQWDVEVLRQWRAQTQRWQLNPRSLFQYQITDPIHDAAYVGSPAVVVVGQDGERDPFTGRALRVPGKRRDVGQRSRLGV